MERIQTDILVIGSGLAGAVAAVSAADEGCQVLIVTKTQTLNSGSTPYAQGGIIYKGHKDSPEKLMQDILTAGAGHCWEKAVRQLCDIGPRLVEEYLVDRFDVDFDLQDDGQLATTAEGAHSVPRIIHSRDHTGKSIHEKMIKALNEHPNVEVLLNHIAIDLLTLSHHSSRSTDIYADPACFGATILNEETGKVLPVFARKTILATGGMGQIYKHTTNPAESRGDGVAMCWRSGAKCINLQYIQFHPTTLYHPSGRFLISEAVRGEGGKLVDKNGVDFMTRFDTRGSLAPRDIVARGIHQIMLETGHPCAYLDISHKPNSWIVNRFPGIYETCLSKGIDMTSEPIPVVPAEHYLCGGVAVGLTGKTSLKRLYAVGETSCTGVHGANRLASTSLLECLVWGHRAGKNAAKKQANDDYYPELSAWFEAKEIIDPALIRQDWETIRSTMWNYVGLIRTRQRLHRARNILRNLQHEVERFYRNAALNDAIIGLRNGLQTSIAIVDQTLEARESLGTHYLIDGDEGLGIN